MWQWGQLDPLSPRRWLAAKSPRKTCTEKNKIKIFEGLSNRRNMVFNVKKLLNVGVDLPLWVGAKRSEVNLEK
jgi:predicted nuclease with RNAse H fold